MTVIRPFQAMRPKKELASAINSSIVTSPLV